MQTKQPLTREQVAAKLRELAARGVRLEVCGSYLVTSKGSAPLTALDREMLRENRQIVRELLAHAAEVAAEGQRKLIAGPPALTAGPVARADVHPQASLQPAAPTGLEPAHIEATASPGTVARLRRYEEEQRIERMRTRANRPQTILRNRREFINHVLMNQF